MYKKSICLVSAGDFIFFHCYFRQAKKVQKKIIVAWAHEKFQSFSTGPSYRGLPKIRPRLREILRSCFTKQFFGCSHTRSSRRTNNPIIRQVKISLILSTLPTVQRRVEIAKNSMVENTKWEQRVEKGRGWGDNCSSISLRSFSRVIAPDRISFPCRLPFSFATPLPRPRDLPRKIRDTSAFTTFFFGYSPFFSPPHRNVTLYRSTPRVKMIVPSEGLSPGKREGNHQIWTVAIRANGNREWEREEEGRGQELVYGGWEYAAKWFHLIWQGFVHLLIRPPCYARCFFLLVCWPVLFL